MPAIQATKTFSDQVIEVTSKLKISHAAGGRVDTRSGDLRMPTASRTWKMHNDVVVLEMNCVAWRAQLLLRPGVRERRSMREEHGVSSLSCVR